MFLKDYGSGKTGFKIHLLSLGCDESLCGSRSDDNTQVLNIIEYLMSLDIYGPVYPLWLSNILASERRRHICNILFHWLRPCPATDRKRVPVLKHFIAQNVEPLGCHFQPNPLLCSAHKHYHCSHPLVMHYLLSQRHIYRKPGIIMALFE